MRNPLFILGISMAILCSCGEVLGQDAFGFVMRKNRNQVRIKFIFQANLIIVPIKINSSDTLRFILDTGVTTTIITDPKLPIIKEMTAVRKVRISGAGDQEPLSATVMIGNRITLGEITGYAQNIVVLDQDALQMSEYIGMPIHGILGYDIFSNYVVTIDFFTRDIILERPEKYRYNRTKGMKFPITIEDSKPYFQALTLENNGRSVPLKVVIDTGAGHAISLDANAQTGIIPPSQNVRVQLGRGLNGNINGCIGRVENLRLGNLALPRPIACFPDSADVSMKLTTNNGRQGNLGCEILRRFRVTFNYHDKYIVLKPIKKKISEPFEHNMSGMDLIADGKDFREYKIERIEPDSPADLAGLQPGDQLININGDLCKNLSISELYKIFQKGEGREVVLAIRRKEQVFITTFVLRRII